MISKFKAFCWCPKVTGFIFVIIFICIITSVHKSTYIWLSLSLILVVLLTTFACRRETPFLYLGSRPQPEEAPSEPQTPIFVTDIPPTYSFVLANPPTPPPSYRSAILMAPGNGNKSKSENGSPKMLRQIFDKSLFRSVSRQLSVEIGNYNLETGQVAGQSSQLADNSSENVPKNNSPILKRLMLKNMLRSQSCELSTSKPKLKRQVSLEVGSYTSPHANSDEQLIKDSRALTAVQSPIEDRLNTDTNDQRPHED